MQKSSFPHNLVPEEFSSKFDSLIKAVLGGWDRLRLCGTLRPLFTPRWMNIYLCAAKVLLKDYGKHALALTERVCQRARQIAQGAGRPYLYVASAQTSKEALIEQIARRDCVREGLIAVLRAVEPCVAISVRADAQKKRLSPVVQMRKCLHLYHYYEHPIWGRCNLRLQSWYPFTVDVCLNRRAWLAKQMDAEGLAYCRADNCFVALQDPACAQALADAQLQADWPQLLAELLREAHPHHSEIIAPLPELRYYWTVTQSEYASDLIFKKTEALEQHYPAFLHHAMRNFQSLDVMRFLGHRVPTTTGKVNGRFKDQIISDLKHRPEGVRIKHRAGGNSVKAYNKHARLLRVETALNQPEVFKVYRPKNNDQTPGDSKARQWQQLRRSIVDLPRRAEVSRAANHRYLQAIASTQGNLALGQAAAASTVAVRWQGRRYRGIRPLEPHDSALLEAISPGQWTLAGFRNRDMRRRIYPSTPKDPRRLRRQSAAIGRRLRLLRAHRIIRKIPRSHRYILTQQGRNLVTALLAAQHADTQKLTQMALENRRVLHQTRQIVIQTIFLPSRFLSGSVARKFYERFGL